MIPLAERMRPKSLDNYIGQKHLVGPDAIMRKVLSTGNIPSMIFWGPPGVGKTTIAGIIAEQVNRPFFALSAINSGVKDIREVIEKASNLGMFATSQRPILFIDEIHRFSKSQQDSLLGAVEKGIITLIGATTENPSFEVISALLSRCQVYILNHLDATDMVEMINQATKADAYLLQYDIVVESYDAMIRFSGGDGRKLYNILEIVVEQNVVDGRLTITDKMVAETLQNNLSLYDKTGEQHYDLISAFIKSVRGSDPDGAIYYMARMLTGGEDPIFICRRMLILASEDIGLANPNALLLANACFQTVHQIGMPEARIPMAECAIYLALSPKSNSAYMAINQAMANIAAHPNLPVPLHLRNAPTNFMKDIGYGKEYLYPHDFKGNRVDQRYLPPELGDVKFYEPGDNSSEKKMNSQP
jgi:putative ATPase